MKRFFGCVLFATLALTATDEVVRSATPKVGVAAAVKNNVSRVVGGAAQPLTLGSDVFTNERIRTGEASTAQILFLDKTTMTVGPHAEITLDSFVYNPSTGAGRVVLNAVRGAMRFVTGSQNPRNYTIKTPVGTVGIRGTIVDIIAGNPTILILVSGSLSATVNGKVYTLTKAGTSYSFYSNGAAQGPQTWDGTIVNTSGDVSTPLYGWYIPGQPNDNGLGPNIGNIDQLNAIIQHSIPAPTKSAPSGGD